MQWWSILRTHLLQILQWWQRAGFQELHRAHHFDFSLLSIPSSLAGNIWAAEEAGGPFSTVGFV
jgi:hypothetical protein